MKFSETGLPDNGRIKQAFEFSQRTILSRQEHEVRVFIKKKEELRERNIRMLEILRKFGAFQSDDQYNAQLAEIEETAAKKIAHAPEHVAEQLEQEFISRSVNIAREISLHSSQPSDQMIVAALLFNGVRSPLDYERIAASFDSGVAGVIAEVIHINAYPHQREEHWKNASSGAKSLSLSATIAQMNDAGAKGEKIFSMNDAEIDDDDDDDLVVMPSEQDEETFYQNAALTWGNDPKLDARFVESFNRMSRALSSDYTVAISEKNELRLIDKKVPALPPPQDPLKPGGPHSGFGEKIF